MGIVVIGSAFVDIKGFPFDTYIPDGRNAGRVEYVHGGVARNVVEDIANVLRQPPIPEGWEKGRPQGSPLRETARTVVRAVEIFYRFSISAIHIM